MEASTLDKFSTVEEIESHLKDLKERRAELDAEYKVKQFSDDARAEWDELNEGIDSTEALLEELRVRHETLARSADDDRRTETAEGAKARRYSSKRTVSREWTFDVGQIRRDSTDDEDLHMSLRDNALHVVEQERYFPAIDRAGRPGEKDVVSRLNREDVQTHIARLLDTIDYGDASIGKVPSELARRILVTGNPVYRRGFYKHMTGKAETPEETRALSVGTGSAGGFAVVYTLDPTIVPTSNFSVNPWRALARIETIAGTNEWKAVTSGAVTFAYNTEAAEASDNAPTLAQPDIIAEKAFGFVPFSIEIGEDWGALEREMGQLFADSKDDLEATKFAIGAGHGSTEPKGIITAATNTVGTTTTQAFVIADLFKLFEALAPRFRPRAKFAANLFVIDKIRQFDTSGGSGVWMGPMSFGLQGGSAAGGEGTIDPGIRIPLLGHPVYEASAMGSVLTTTTKILIVGDWRYFVIVDRIGLNVEVLPLVVGTAHRPTGQRGLYAYFRNSSDALSAAAFQVLVT